MVEMHLLTLIFLSVSGVYSDSHSLRYYLSGVSTPEYGLPDYFRVGYVDDQQIELYTSDIGRIVPVAHWIKENESPEFWEEWTIFNKENEALFRHDMKLWKENFSHTRGFHYLQVIAGCELRDDGSIMTYKQYGYDGENYIYYDSPTATFIPILADVQNITQWWNRMDVGAWKRTKNCLENDCITRLKRIIGYGRKDLERRVRPRVKVSYQRSGEVTKLHCLVYGFYPRAVDLSWMKNRTDEVPTYETTHVLPNPDGTYQIRVTVEVIPKEDDSYSCYVDHTSLEEPLLVKWEPKQDSHWAVVIGAVVVILVLFAFIALVLMYRRKQKNYKEVSASVKSSDNPVTA